MGRTVFILIFCVVVKGEIGTHFYVPKALNWSEAQSYCRRHFTELSFINGQSDMEKLNAKGKMGWIGLYCHPDDHTLWKWSGGGRITYQKWAPKQPDDAAQQEDNGFLMLTGKWNDVSGVKSSPFYCINVTVVKEKKSWEEALKYCREHQTDLPSVVSETDRLVAQREIQHSDLTGQVWIGLRYLGGHWLWVNNDTLQYEAWPQTNQNQMCPVWERCGALNKEGQWQAMDCLEELNFICI